MQAFAKVKDDPSVERDMRTGALVSTPDELDSYRKKKISLLREKERDNKINKMENDIKDIKSILGDLVTLLQTTK